MLVSGAHPGECHVVLTERTAWACFTCHALCDRGFSPNLFAAALRFFSCRCILLTRSSRRSRVLLVGGAFDHACHRRVPGLRRCRHLPL